MLEVGYVASKGTHLSSFFNANDAPRGPGDPELRRPFKNVGGFSEDRSVATSSYQGATVKLEKRLSSNLTFITNYAYSKSLDLCSSFGCGSVQDSENYKADIGYSEFHSRHIFSMGYVTALPFGPGKRYLGNLRGVGGQIVGGWQINGIISARSGRPLNFQINKDNANTGQRSFNQRPDLTGEVYPSGFNTTPEKWFNTAAFALPAQYTYGNLGRNAVIGPGLQSWDFGIFKNFRLGEVSHIQFRAELFNAFNHTNFGNPGTTLGNPDFGIIGYTTTNSREIQFGLKYIF